MFYGKLRESSKAAGRSIVAAAFYFVTISSMRHGDCTESLLKIKV
ncbi:hypothetical protein J2Z66_007192 [Paenibacillus eucommiae]|uniref:Uncharacterized protein n=1 Tax=Paenibacillus eucommiae TaxID=1355755 RepID=A0ABS4J6W4_9BACL|nr:hypothetical protein [Paenibacillus eucommiae]